MALRDLAQFLEDDGLEYPIPASSFAEPARFPNGKTYRVASPSATVGLWLVGLTDLGLRVNAGADLTPDDLARLKLDDEGEKTLYQRVLGATYDEMVADGILWTALGKVGRDAYLCFAMSQEAADVALAAVGEAGARGNRATHRATAKKTGGSKSRRASTAATASVPAPTSRTSASSTSPNAPEGPAAAAV